MEDLTVFMMALTFILALLFMLIAFDSKNDTMSAVWHLLSTIFWFPLGVMILSGYADTAFVVPVQYGFYGLGMINFLFFVLNGVQALREANEIRKYGETEY